MNLKKKKPGQEDPSFFIYKENVNTEVKQFEEIFQNLTLKETDNPSSTNRPKNNRIVDITLFGIIENNKYINDFKQISAMTLIENKVFSYNNDVKHPLIKYIIFILNDLIVSKVSEEKFYPIFLIYIFRYIKFIVNQGESIVTNLEHLKFFFLSNTFNIENYNTEANEENKKFKFEASSKDKSTETLCKPNNTLDCKREYIKDTEAAPGIILKEKINIGNMVQYRLLSVLQDLAGETSDLYKLKINDKGILDLFTIQDPPKPATLKSLFIMFTNIKIFRDDTKGSKFDSINGITNENKSNYQLLCGAEQDTLEFAQSISSTTQNTLDGGSISINKNTSHKTPKKFNMKELTKKHKKQNRIITIKKQEKKNNNKKSLFVRRSKKYQD